MNKQTKTFITITALVFIAIFAFILFGLKETPEERGDVVEYNYFTFTRSGPNWETQIERDNKVYLASFRYNPKDTEDVYITGNFTGFEYVPLYITFDPDSEQDDFKYLALTSTELSLHLIRGLGYNVSAACTKNETQACTDRPIVRCGDEGKSVIYIVNKAPTQITLKDNCIVLSGEGLELVRAADRLIFQWYKIMR